MQTEEKTQNDKENCKKNWGVSLFYSNFKS